MNEKCEECGTKLEFHYSEFYGSAEGSYARTYHYTCPKCKKE